MAQASSHLFPKHSFRWDVTLRHRTFSIHVYLHFFDFPAFLQVFQRFDRPSGNLCSFPSFAFPPACSMPRLSFLDHSLQHLFVNTWPWAVYIRCVLRILPSPAALKYPHADQAQSKRFDCQRGSHVSLVIVVKPMGEMCLIIFECFLLRARPGWVLAGRHGGNMFTEHLIGRSCRGVFTSQRSKTKTNQSWRGLLRQPSFIPGKGGTIRSVPPPRSTQQTTLWERSDSFSSEKAWKRRVPHVKTGRGIEWFFLKNTEMLKTELIVQVSPLNKINEFWCGQTKWRTLIKDVYVFLSSIPHFWGGIFFFPCFLSGDR